VCVCVVTQRVELMRGTVVLRLICDVYVSHMYMHTTDLDNTALHVGKFSSFMHIPEMLISAHVVQ